MNEKTEKLNGKGAILTMSILAIICLIVGLLFMAIPYFTNGNNMHEAIQTWTNAYIYYLAAILLVMLPYYLKDLKKRGGGFELLKQEIIDKDKLWGDILFGVLSGVISVIIWLVIAKIEMSYLPNKGNTNVSDHTPIIIKLLVLCIIAPIVKEIVFRLYSKLFLEDKYGIFPAALISSIIFGVFDWHNGGLSFVAGIIWYLFYIKRRRLIVPMVGHCMINLIPIILNLFIAS